MTHFKTLQILLSWRYHANTKYNTKEASHDMHTELINISNNSNWVSRNIWQTWSITSIFGRCQFINLTQIHTYSFNDTKVFHSPTIESHSLWHHLFLCLLIGWGGREVSPWLFSVIMAFDDTGYKHHCHTPQLRRTTNWRERKWMVI